MKKYFDFTLSAKRFFPIWLAYLFLAILPYVVSVRYMSTMQAGGASTVLPLVGLLVSVIVMFVVAFYVLKICIESLSYNGTSLKFNGKFGPFFGKVILGFLLSVITLSIYTAWFIKNITTYLLNNIELNSKPFGFKGEASSLFVILLFTLIVPAVAIGTVLCQVMSCSAQGQCTACIQLIMLVMMIPYLYYMYKWMVDISYKTYTINWKTEFFSSFGKIFRELFFTIITLGIYLPIAHLRLYKYFVDRTEAVSFGEAIKFGYDFNSWRMFAFVWGQILLTVFTCGIYYPWALSKVGKRVLSHTYVTPIRSSY